MAGRRTKEFADVQEPAVPGLRWRVTERPTQWWRRPWLRTFARADVVATDGRRYVVRVIPVLWPRDSPVLDGAGELVPGAVASTVWGVATLFFRRRSVWGVRVFRERSRFRVGPLMYGEELGDLQAGVERAHEIATALAAGQMP